MSDGTAKHWDWSAVVAVGLAVGIAYTGVVASWIVLDERTKIHEREISDHESRIRKAESDRELLTELNKLRIEMVELRSEQRATRDELHTMNRRKGQ